MWVFFGGTQHINGREEREKENASGKRDLREISVLPLDISMANSICHVSFLT